MLPLTEGSLRLRADDEDSLTSEDSFFSATEVTGRWGHRGRGGLRPGLCGAGVSTGVGKGGRSIRLEQNLAAGTYCSPGTACSAGGGEA